LVHGSADLELEPFSLVQFESEPFWLELVEMEELIFPDYN
jgi:hypothetical protein